MNNEKAFWMVWGDGCGVPSYKHDTPKSAQNEADRLAIRHPGTKFYVLGAIGYSEKIPETRFVNLEIGMEVPFE